MKPQLPIAASLLALSSIPALGILSQIKQPQPPSDTKPKPTTEVIQIIFQPNTAELASMTEDVLYHLSKMARSKHLMEISLLSESGVGVIFSKAPTRRAIQDLRSKLDADPATPEIEPTPSEDEQLVAAVQRFSDRALTTGKQHPVTVYILTGGTSDPTVLAQIEAISENLAQQGIPNARLFLIGVDPNHRLTLAKAFAPIGGAVEFAGPEYSEWIQLLRKF